VLGRGSAEYGRPSFFWYTVYMDIKVFTTPYEEAINTGLVLGEDHQILEDGMWINHIRRETGRKDLFVYYHKLTEKFVLAHWIYPPWEVDKPVCLELTTMDLPPDRGGWIPTPLVKLRCRATDPAEKLMSKRIQERDDAKEAGRTERLERRTSMVDHLKRKGQHDIASSLSHSNVNYTEDSQIKEDLINAGKGRVVTGA